MVGPRVFSSGDVLYGGQPFDIFAEVEQPGRRAAPGAAHEGLRRAHDQGLPAAAPVAADLLRGGLRARSTCCSRPRAAGELQTDLTMALDGFTAFEHSLPVELGEDAVQLARALGHALHADPARVLRRRPGASCTSSRRATRTTTRSSTASCRTSTLDRLGAAPSLDLARRVPLPDRGRGRGRRRCGPAATSPSAPTASSRAWASTGSCGRWRARAAGRRARRMTPHEALRAATIAAADKIGFAPDLGSVEAGKLADLVVLDADPLADIHNTDEDPLGRQERRGLRSRDDEAGLAAEGSCLPSSGRSELAGAASRVRLLARGIALRLADLAVAVEDRRSLSRPRADFQVLPRKVWASMAGPWRRTKPGLWRARRGSGGPSSSARPASAGTRSLPRSGASLRTTAVVPSYSSRRVVDDQAALGELPRHGRARVRGGVLDVRPVHVAAGEGQVGLDLLPGVAGVAHDHPAHHVHAVAVQALDGLQGGVARPAAALAALVLGASPSGSPGPRPGRSRCPRNT